VNMEAYLGAYLGALHQQGRFNGAVLMRRHDHTLLECAYGAANRAQGQPNTSETIFQIASISKQFAAAAILLLQEDGALSIHDRLQTWAPGGPAGWEAITVHHLLTHTAGIGHWQDLPEVNLFEPTTRERLLDIVRRHPLKFAPGAGWAYSSPAYALLAHIIEDVAGEPYASFLQRRLFQPLGMAGAGAGNHSPYPDRQALGYAGADRSPSVELDTVLIGAGDIWATTGDLARWNAALATPGLLNAAALQAMFTPHTATPEGFVGAPAMAYGYGWVIGELHGRRLRFHTGDNAGFRSINLRLPDDEAVIILLSNDEIDDKHSGLFALSRPLVAAVLGDADSESSQDA
jgi:CubicO group peptidase (beta-lactamase class C family)